MSFLQSDKIQIDSLKNLYQQYGVAVDVLRLDIIHPVVSGNKWFKLREYLKDAQQQQKKNILTFGGAYSNHIIATAAACNMAGLTSVGMIRGQVPPQLSHTLKDAEAFGIELFFISRDAYQKKIIPQAVWEQFAPNETYVINEGGYGLKGRQGAESMVQNSAFHDYTHIAAAVGTGTTLAGLVAASLPAQLVMGISALKNHFALHEAINRLLPEELHNRCVLFHQYHFGGYAKHTSELLNFMNNWYTKTSIPLDFIYTAKLFYAINDLICSRYFSPGSKLLLIHSGGLQGNRSLPKGTLIFEHF